MQDDKIPTEMRRQFKGLWIPVEILNAPMSAIAKLLWADIHSFTGNNSCFFKSNKNVADSYGVSERSVSRAIKQLQEAGLIEVESDGRTRKCRSRLDKMSMQGRQNDEAVSSNWLHREQEKEQERQQKIKKYGREAKPKDLQEVELYFASKAADVREAHKFHDYYEGNGWVQGRKGKPIKNWKAVARNWIRNAEQWNTKPRGFDAGNFTTDGAIDFVTHG